MGSTDCRNAVISYSNLTASVSQVETFARNSLASDRRAAIVAIRISGEIALQADRFGARARNVCSPGTSLANVEFASRSLGALRGRSQALQHYAHKVTPPKPRDPKSILAMARAIDAKIPAADARRHAAIDAVARW
jgi:hypothetical protein